MPNASVGSGSILEEFGRAVWDEAGFVADSREWGLYEVLEPDGTLKMVTFDAEIAQERRDVEFISYGSQALLALQEKVRCWGKTDTTLIMPEALQVPGDLNDKIRSLAHLAKCRPQEVRETRFGWGASVLFRFHVTYQTADMIEELLDVLIDLSTLADITTLLGPLDRAPVAGWDDRVPPLSLLPIHTADEAYWRAVTVASARIQTRRLTIAKDYGTQQADELAQSQHYYETTLRGLERQLQTAADDTRRARVRQKILATQAEWAHRQEDIQRAYTVTCEVVLDQARLFWTPTLRVFAHALQRTDVRPIHFDWYPWARTWAPAVCSKCHEAASTLYYGAAGWHCGCQVESAG